MAFIDEVRIHAVAGTGGSGVVRWLRTKEKAKGGPAGGDGGKGGDIVLRAVRDLSALSYFRYTKKFRAENGAAGENNNKHGADGKSIVLPVPVGTSAQNATTKEIHELLTEGEEVVIFRGGGGGFGNAHFKGSTNQNPFISTEGKKGEAGDINLTLKLIGDAGLIGFPNAGKSSLLNALTRAKSKVGAYPFTTLDPHLGDFYGHLLADIPGLIAGASAGRGLGSKFLRHIERTRILLHLVSAEQDDVATAYRAIREELAAFGKGLEQKKELVVLSKVDLISKEELIRKEKQLRDVVEGREVIRVSVEDDALLKAFSDHLAILLKNN